MGKRGTTKYDYFLCGGDVDDVEGDVNSVLKCKWNVWPRPMMFVELSEISKLE